MKIRKRTTPEPDSRDPVHGDTYKHASFGSIRASRYSNGPKMPLFGSKVMHYASTVVSIEVQEADYIRSFSGDHVHPGSRMLRIEMSEAQFASFITNMNSSSIPCTIKERRVGGTYERMPDTPFFGIVEQFDIEMKDRLDDVGQRTKVMADQLDKMLASKTVSKTELRELRSELLRTLEHLPGNLDYFAEQFGKAMDGSVEEAKRAIEAHVDNVIRATGIESIRQQAPALTAGDEGEQ